MDSEGPVGIFSALKPGGACSSIREIVLESFAFPNYVNMITCILCIHLKTQP